MTAVAVGTLPVSEVFGPTIQGEGPAAGTLATFIRFSGCDLSCSWCDTPYTWDTARYDVRGDTRHVRPAELVEQVWQLGTGGIVVLTGGEPLLQQGRPEWTELLAALSARWPVHIETNGTIVPTGDTLSTATCIVVSPKLANAGPHRGHQDPGMPTGWCSIIEAGPFVPTSATIHVKVVCLDADDVARAVDLSDEIGCPRERLWVMPEGTDRDTLTDRWPVIAEAAAAHGVNATNRLHVLAWGNTRGR